MHDSPSSPPSVLPVSLSSPLPPLAWLQAFEAAARLMSFTRAAEELSVTQSAISQRIRQLEDRLGQPLFVRHARSLNLTPAGQAWLPALQDGFQRLQEGTLEVFGPSRAAPVSLRATPMSQQAWLLPRLASFHRDQPEIALRLVSAFWARDFDGEEVDIELRYGQGDWPQVEAIKVGAEQERMIVVASSALSSRLSTAADLTGMTLLHAAGFAVGWRRWLVAAGQLGLEKTTSTISCDTQVMTLEMARLGMGVALVHEGHFQQWMASGNGGLEQAFPLAIPAEQHFWLVRSSQRPMRPTAQRVWDYLMEKPAVTDSGTALDASGNRNGGPAAAHPD